MLYRGETQYIKRRVQEFSKPVNYIYHIGQYLPIGTHGKTTKTFLWAISRTGGVREIFGIDLPWLLDTVRPGEACVCGKDKLSAL